MKKLVAEPRDKFVITDTDFCVSAIYDNTLKSK